MIKIKKVHIKRFRSIMDLKIEIDQNNNFITICGENNSGKTNTLRAMNIFFNPEQYDYEKDTPFHKLEGSQGGKVFPNIVIEFSDDSKVYKIERNFEKDQYKLSGQKIESGSSEELTEKQCIAILNKIHFFYIESINVSYPKLINNLIDTVFEVAFAKSRFSGGKKALKTAYEAYTKGLLEVLQNLSKDINPLFQEYKENWEVEFDLDSDIKKFRDIITDDIEFFINDSSNKHIDSKGSGLQRLAYILLHFKIIEKLKKNTILVIDEPDIFLHQSLQKTLHKHMQQVKSSAQIFITTHSPVFIDSYTLNNVFLLDLEITEKYYQRRKRTYNELKTKLVNISGVNGDHKIKEYLGIDNKDFEVLRNYNILVEGESDLIYLSELGKYFGMEVPNIIPLGGVDNATRELSFYNNFYHDTGVKPKVVLLVDNDRAGRDVFDKVVKNKSKSHYNNLDLKIELLPNVLGENTKESAKNNEVEDFVYPEIIVELVNKVLAKKSLRKIIPARIETKISQAAFKNSGILTLVENEKNERNPEDGGSINIASESVKNSMSKFFKIEGNTRLIKLLEVNDQKFPEVRSYLYKLFEGNL
ncbi:AAA family ATPase [Sulfurovum sp. XGS-02]|uniref:ATP-dependent nuclease n=1 Tax=Sulfurovum sp. XGS-02 TaxID=2925411 RepID=UPI002065C751|nr:AAA family ATPase [Sulfurovum sp. XGS-02]UPT78172.1 AAA family ATPase [Sulfurovum sp. XGS-02]